MVPATQKQRTDEPAELVSALREFKILDATFSIGGLQDRLFVLLSAIDDLGSLVAAAKQAGLSYKGAWDMIERASLLSPRPLIERNPGGGSDRGTRLTETGRGLLDIHRRLEVKKIGLLEELNRELSNDPILLQWYRRLILQSSARNQWRAEVLSIKTGVVRSEVAVRLPWGAVIIAIVSREMMNRMRLDFGTPVIALVKASMVHLISGAEGFEVSAENHFDGQISEIVKDQLSAEITVGLSSGDRVVTTVSAEESARMSVKEGERVTVFFDAEAVVLATLPSSKETR